ncbi:hypothetical protein A607_1017 [Helicobacter pylori UMB_G1]|nr:hypothetical protein A607_1017 [Helicobacter pylori UMB_G1]
MWIGKKSWIALLNSTEFFRVNGGYALLILFNLILFNLILFNLGLAFMER